jgi:hypothetical protein
LNQFKRAWRSPEGVTLLAERDGKVADALQLSKRNRRGFSRRQPQPETLAEAHRKLALLSIVKACSYLLKIWQL